MKNKKIYLFIIVVLISVFKIYSYNVNNKFETEEEYVYGLTAPRGRILDVNGNILVDNKQVKVIIANTYGLSEKDIIESCNKLKNIIDIKLIKIYKYIILFFIILLWIKT